MNDIDILIASADKDGVIDMARFNALARWDTQLDIFVRDGTLRVEDGKYILVTPTLEK